MLIEFSLLFQKYQIKATGIIHLGASSGQEVKAYADLGIRDMVFVEALPHVYNQLVRNVEPYKALCINECIGENDGEELWFNVANNDGQSSSLLEFGSHATSHPTVKFIDKIKVNTKRVDTIIKEYKIDMKKFNFLVADLQGIEMTAFKSMGEYLRDIKYLYCELNTDEVYRGCTKLPDLDLFLLGFGFKRVETKIFQQWSWGDGLYIKK